MGSDGVQSMCGRSLVQKFTLMGLSEVLIVLFLLSFDRVHVLSPSGSAVFSFFLLALDFGLDASAQLMVDLPGYRIVVYSAPHRASPRPS